MLLHRFHKLDAVRGVAAFVVVLNHAYNLIPGDNWHNFAFDYTPLSHLVNGRVAVIIFFVLSGFVLTIPYLKRPETPYPQFVFRRFCRIYLPFAMALAFATLLASQIAFPKAEWALGDHDWTTPVDFQLVASHLLMIGVDYSSISLNPPMWTLIQEMRISLMFPLMAFLIVRYSWKALAVVVALAIVSTKTSLIVGETFDDKVPSSLLTSSMLTFYYSYFFFIGIFLASHMERAVELLRKVPTSVHLLVVVGFFLAPKAIVEGSFLLGDFAYALLAAYIIVSCIAFPLQTAFLETRALRWSGRVSYSMYLIHVPIMLALNYVLHDHVPILAILALAIFLTLIAAEIFYRFVEQPAMRLGRTYLNPSTQPGKPQPTLDS
ncbi:acyltransferase family protein [Rhizobium mongolense]|uniref:acyltransferase family protein n=1 Tax=Rhizobium mongolense TaxID=57676 RepID=UPI0034A267D7